MLRLGDEVIDGRILQLRRVGGREQLGHLGVGRVDPASDGLAQDGPRTPGRRTGRPEPPANEQWSLTLTAGHDGQGG